MRRICLSMVALVFAGSSADAVRANPVSSWMEAASTFGGQARSQVGLAMFEAANAIDRRYESYLGFPAAIGEANGEAAVASAAHGVLKFAYPGQSVALQTALDLVLGQIPDGPAKSRGIEIGVAAAEATMRRVTITGNPARNYVPEAKPGIYVPTELPILPLGAYETRTWFMSSPGEFPLRPPPPLGSSVWARDYDEVRRLGRKTNSERKPAQTSAAHFWATALIDVPFRLLTTRRQAALVQDARAYALLAMATADANAAMTVAKYDHKFWRPITAIRNGASDGNPETVADESWEPLLRTPLHPEYPCGHCVLAATMGTILKAEFGKEAKLTFTEPSMPGTTVTLTPDEYVTAVSLSRIHAGVHFRSSNEAGEELGRRIGQKALAGYMRPLAKRSR